MTRSNTACLYDEAVNLCRRSAARRKKKAEIFSSSGVSAGLLERERESEREGESGSRAGPCVGVSPAGAPL